MQFLENLSSKHTYQPGMSTLKLSRALGFYTTFEDAHVNIDQVHCADVWNCPVAIYFQSSYDGAFLCRLHKFVDKF